MSNSPWILPVLPKPPPRVLRATCRAELHEPEQHANTIHALSRRNTRMVTVPSGSINTETQTAASKTAKLKGKL